MNKQIYVVYSSHTTDLNELHRCGWPVICYEDGLIYKVSKDLHFSIEDVSSDILNMRSYDFAEWGSLKNPEIFKLLNNW